MIFYFSGTGNTRHTARILAKRTNEQLYDIATELRQHSGKDFLHYAPDADERIGFAFPVHSWGPPEIVTDFIRRLALDGYQEQYCYFVCTCGDDVGETCNILKQVLAERGYRLDAGFNVFMPNTYVSFPGFDIDDEQTATRKLHDAVERTDAICEKIIARERNRFELFEGTCAKLKSYVVRPLFNRFLLTDRPFHVTTDCISCGKCATVCPTGNIRMTDGKPQWLGHCTSCLACYHYCPSHAIMYGRLTRQKGQYNYEKYTKKSIK